MKTLTDQQIRDVRSRVANALQLVTGDQIRAELHGLGNPIAQQYERIKSDLADAITILDSNGG